jgi:hypothetical protein
VTGVSLYLAFCCFEYPFPSIFTHLAVLGLLHSGLVAAVAALGLAPRLPAVLAAPLARVPELPAGAEQIRPVVAALGERLVAAVARANALLRWTRPKESARALAYAWLATQHAFLLSPGWLLFFWVLGFALAPAYTFFQRDVDAAVSTQVLPKVDLARGVCASVAQRATAALCSNTAAPVAAATVACALLYVFWDWWTFAGLATREYCSASGRLVGGPTFNSLSRSLPPSRHSPLVLPAAVASFSVTASDAMNTLAGTRKAD